MLLEERPRALRCAQGSPAAALRTSAGILCCPSPPPAFSQSNPFTAARRAVGLCWPLAFCFTAAAPREPRGALTPPPGAARGANGTETWSLPPQPGIFRAGRCPQRCGEGWRNGGKEFLTRCWGGGWCIDMQPLSCCTEDTEGLSWRWDAAAWLLAMQIGLKNKKRKDLRKWAPKAYGISEVLSEREGWRLAEPALRVVWGRSSPSPDGLQPKLVPLACAGRAAGGDLGGLAHAGLRQPQVQQKKGLEAELGLRCPES